MTPPVDRSLADRVLHASSSALWQPDGSRTTDTGHGLLVQYPSWAYPRLALARFATGGTDGGTDGGTAAAVDRVLDVARTLHDRATDELTWEVVLGSPADLPDILSDRGARLADTVDVLALDLLADLPDVGPVDERVQVGWVDDLDSARGFSEVAIAGFGGEPSTEERLRSVAATARDALEQGTGGRAIASIDGHVVAGGGVSIEGDVARLWGASALVEARGIGAYRAVLHQRLELARDHGATLALVKGRVATSGPILHRFGFTGFGQEQMFQVPLDPEQT